MTEALRSALEDLAANAPRKSETARLHGHLEQIEHALRLGVSRAQIFETLQKQGFRMNLKSFETALYRLRKRSRLAEASASVTPPVRQPRGEEENVESVPSQAGEVPAIKPPRQTWTPSAKIELPSDWQTAHLTPEQIRSLTPEQKKERDHARDAKFFPNRLRPPAG